MSQGFGSPAIAKMIWAGLDESTRAAAERGDYASPEHDCHALHVLSRELAADVVLNASDDDLRSMGIQPPTEWVN